MNEMKRTLTEVLSTTDKDGMLHMTIKTNSTGKVSTYKVYHEVYYDQETPDDLIKLLHRLHESQTRFRVFYGDKETGRDWLEECDTMGRMGVSTGEIKIPLLIKNSRSWGGVGLLTHCILKLVDLGTGNVLWQHPSYQVPSFTVYQRGEEGFPNDLPLEYTTAVYYNGSNQANFRSPEKAIAYIRFIKGNQHVTRFIKAN